MPVTRPSKTYLLMAISLLLALATFLTYWPVIHCDFVDWDDHFFILENTHVRDGLTWAGIQWASHSVVCANWHPATMISHMLDCQFFGLDAGKHHLMNLLFHAANGVLLFFLLRRLTGAVWRSAVVAALFALHPLRVESVAWISERKDVLCAFFFLLTIWSYAAWTTRRTAFRYVGTLVLFALALMSKPMAVTLPFVLLLLDLWPLGRVRVESEKKRVSAFHSPLSLSLLLEKIPFFALSIALSIITFILQRQTGAVHPADQLPPGFHWTNPFISYVRYLEKLFWPAHLSPMYLRSDPWPLWQVGLAVLFLIAISVLTLRYWRQRPYLAVGWFWYLGTLVPVIGFVQQGDQCLADRFTYLPIIGILIMLIWGAHDLAQKWSIPKPALAVLVLIPLMACATMTRAQLSFWRNTETLFNRIPSSDRNAIAFNALGCYYLAHARPKEAATQFSTALQMRPLYADAHNNLGAELAGEGRYAEAIPHFKTALELAPAMVNAQVNWAAALANSGDLDGTVQHYQAALTLDPDSFATMNSLGVCYSQQGKFAEAEREYIRALQLNPRHALIRANLGKTLFSLHRYPEAEAQYQIAAQLEPNSYDAQFHLGLLLAIKGDRTQAEPHLKEALRLEPTSAEAQQAMALLQRPVSPNK